MPNIQSQETSKIQEQRTAARTTLNAEISIVSDHAVPENFRARNLSVGGLFIECSAAALSVGDRLVIQFDGIGADDNDHMDAIVVHLNATGAGLAWKNSNARLWISLMQLMAAFVRGRNDDLAKSAHKSRAFGALETLRWHDKYSSGTARSTATEPLSSKA